MTTPTLDPDDAAARTTASPDAGVPVVGIGASAGGLDPICEFLASVPPASGMAYMVAQHVDTQHQVIFTQLLQRVTAMPVSEVQDGMTLLPDRVYVMPPRGQLILDGDRVALQPHSVSRQEHLSIDRLFMALARHSAGQTVGVVLSGMGADGTLGLKAIRDSGGLTMAQLPPSARFESMPASAISAGVVDVVAPPAELARRALDWWRRDNGHGANLDALRQREALQQMYQLLLAQTGANFSDYKLSTVMRRIERRMKLRQCRELPVYIDYLRENPAEVELLFKELLIGVTNFFRGPKVWEYLIETALPQLLERHPHGAAFKAWVPACSTGEEAYTLAISFHEVLAQLRPTVQYTLQIFATDLDDDAVARAPGRVQRRHPRRCRRAAPAALFRHRGRWPLPDPQGHPQYHHLRAPEHHFRPAVYQARCALLSQPADILYGQAAARSDSLVPLRAQAGRFAAAGKR
jgi:two-component system CheB/CheR fusion protein